MVQQKFAKKIYLQRECFINLKERLTDMKNVDLRKHSKKINYAGVRITSIKELLNNSMYVDVHMEIEGGK